MPPFSALLQLGALKDTRTLTFWCNVQTHRVTGNVVYDYFMGAILNPRLFNGRLDLKMWAETRVSWTLLFLVTLSAAAEQWATKGHVSGPMAFMLLAHFLYANATMKGEECIPTTCALPALQLPLSRCASCMSMPRPRSSAMH